MLSNLTNANVPSSLRSVTLKGTALTYRANVGGDVWQDTPIATPFAFDFGTLQHGWVKYPPKGSKGLRAEWDMYPVTQDLGEGTREGWTDVATCHIASRELGGPARLECTKPALARAIVDLHNRYQSHYRASQDEIPVVVPVVDDITAIITLEIKGWIKRPAQLGERLIPVPPMPQGVNPLPREISVGNPLTSAGYDPHILDLLRKPQEDARNARTVAAYKKRETHHKSLASYF